MKFVKLMMAVACVAGLAGSLYAQSAQSAPNVVNTKPIFGYMDRRGMFHSLSRPLPEEAEAPITPTSGTMVFNITITVNAKLPSNAVITCGVTGGTSDVKTGEFSNSVFVTATRTGSTAKCTLTVPYTWDLATPTTDVADWDVEVDATVGTLGSTGFYDETFVGPLITLKVPATGTTTTETIATSI